MRAGHRGLCGSVLLSIYIQFQNLQGATVVRLNQDVISLETPE